MPLSKASYYTNILVLNSVLLSILSDSFFNGLLFDLLPIFLQISYIETQIHHLKKFFIS